MDKYSSKPSYIELQCRLYKYYVVKRPKNMRDGLLSSQLVLSKFNGPFLLTLINVFQVKQNMKIITYTSLIEQNTYSSKEAVFLGQRNLYNNEGFVKLTLMIC